MRRVIQRLKFHLTIRPLLERDPQTQRQGNVTIHADNENLPSEKSFVEIFLLISRRKFATFFTN
jgi:hypothetical protein